MVAARELENPPDSGVLAHMRRHRLEVGTTLIVIGWLLALYSVFPKTTQETYTGLLVAEGPGRNTYVFVLPDQDASALAGATLSLLPLDSSEEFVVTVSVGNSTITALSSQQLNMSLAGNTVAIDLPGGRTIIYRYELVFSRQQYHPQTDTFIALGGLMLSVAGLYLASHTIISGFERVVKKQKHGKRNECPPP